MKNTRKISVNSITLEDKLIFLSKPLWDYNDIRKYFHIGKNKAIAIKDIARKANGNLPKYEPTKATAKSVMEIQGLNIDEEIRRLKAIISSDKLDDSAIAHC